MGIKQLVCYLIEHGALANTSFPCGAPQPAGSPRRKNPDWALRGWYMCTKGIVQEGVLGRQQEQLCGSWLWIFKSSRSRYLFGEPSPMVMVDETAGGSVGDIIDNYVIIICGVVLIGSSPALLMIVPKL